jgi:cytoplasmic iron level regulating protein YaaA (DUF328/UPF0246 family)
MLVLLSPSKTQNFLPIQNQKINLKPTLPHFLNEISQLIQSLKPLSSAQISELMKISPKLAELNYQRFQTFTADFVTPQAKSALFAFEGDVYTDIAVNTYSQKELDFAQKTIRILSGLYGILAPTDLIQPYRLEMKTKLKTQTAKDLYQFWGPKITDYLNQAEANLIVNLASEEYFKVIQPKNLKADLLNIAFKQKRPNGQYKIVPIYAKKARGTMTNFIVQNQIQTSQQLTEFKEDNYKFSPQDSTNAELVFIR